MTSHLSIEVDGKELSLPSDFALDIEEQNPLFEDVEMYSYPVEIPIEGNRHILGNVDDPYASTRPFDFERLPAKILVEGLPFRDGNIITSDDEEISDSLSCSIDARTQTLKDLVDSLNCQDIPVKDDIKIGEKLGSITVKPQEIKTETEGTIWFFGAEPTDSQKAAGYVKGPSTGEMVYTPVHFSVTGTTIQVSGSGVAISPQALGFSVPGKCTEDITKAATIASSENTTGKDADGNTYVQNTPQYIESYINTSKPYDKTDPAHTAYCNARIAYKHYDLEDNGETSDNVDKEHPYLVLDANRPQSGICFYLLYFLDCLFAHLDLEWDDTALYQIEDFRRLCFFTTKCSYEERVKAEETNIAISKVNAWLSSRGCGTKLSIDSDINHDAEAGDTYEVGWYGSTFTTPISLDSRNKSYNLATPLSLNTSAQMSPQGGSQTMVLTPIGDTWTKYLYYYRIESARVRATDITSGVNVSYAEMYADSGNFPDESVSTILGSLENQFGIRFDFDPDKRKVTARLLRDVYKMDKILPLSGEVTDIHKVSEKITGVRIMYSAESDAKEQQDNLRDKKRDYATDFDYVDYPAILASKPTGMSLASHTDITKTFRSLPTATSTDNTCYIDRTTGNAYRVKVDSEATEAGELKPVWFEVGQFKGAEFGDCSKKKIEDYVEEFSSSFEPLSYSDVNNAKVKGSSQPLLVAYCDEDMEHEYVLQGLSYVAPVSTSLPYGSQILIDAMMNLKEAYDPESSDTGNSPLQSHDWGLAIAIMRGGNAGSTTEQYAKDAFGNYKLRTVMGTYSLTSDSIDPFGNHYDYNQSAEGIGRGERFSLKMRAYKTTPWTDDQGNILATDGIPAEDVGKNLCAADEYDPDEGWYYIRNRGCADVFMADHARFLLTRKKYRIKMLLSPADITYIKQNWLQRFRIHDLTGFIAKVSYTLRQDTPLAEAELLFYSM